jgi:PAS domain S-box-containing protein
MAAQSNYFEKENKRLMIVPLQIISALVIVAGTFALIFEINYFEEFSIGVYFGRLVATIIGFIILILGYMRIGRENPIFLIHVLLITIIASFASIIYHIPESLYVNSHLLALVIFTSALFLTWEIRHQIIVVIYYNLLFAASVLLSDKSIYFLPSVFSSVLFVMAISIMSIVASAVNFKLRLQSLKKTFEAKDIIENSSDAIFKATTKGQVLLTNPSFRKIFKLDEQEGESELNLKDLLSDSRQFTSMVKKLKEFDTLKDFEVKLNVSDKEIYVNMNVFLSPEDGNNERYLNGSMHDVTEKRLAEEKVKQYNQELENLNQSKDKFFSIIAHDLITPIAALLGYSEILANENEKLETKIINEFARSINTVSKSAHNLLLELLDWSRIHTGRMPCTPMTIDVSYISREVNDLLKENLSIKKIELKNEIPSGQEVYADFKMLNSIMRNLVGNAIKFTKSGGVIRISSKKLDDGFLEISIEDDGAGIKKKDLAKLFKIDEHFTTKGTANEKGSGLGLILCNEFVKKNGGVIWAESEIGKGTRISFTLPLSDGKKK